MVITGDMWQFPPVKATAIYQNPFASGYSFQVAALQKFFWSRRPEGILFELTVEQRCADPWLSYVLKQARHGAMAHEVWCYLHGFPTLHPGSWDFGKAEVTCGRATCQQLVDTWACSDCSWPERVTEECKVCQTERTRRCVIGRDQKAAKFLLQPYIHGLNAAKYIAANLRAKEVAAQQGTAILWIVAQDTPLFHLDTDATSELHARKSNWLQRHDQSTGGAVGLLPLIPDMPVRVTQTLPELRPYGLYKNTRGKLIDWTLSEQDTARIPGMQAPDLNFGGHAQSVVCQDRQRDLAATSELAARCGLYPSDCAALATGDRGQSYCSPARLSHCIRPSGHGPFVYGGNVGGLYP